IYELCCGRPPFIGEGTGDVLAAHIHLPVPPISLSHPDIPPVVERITQRLLAKAPADRLQSAEELIRAIDAVTADVTVVASGPRLAVPVLIPSSVTTLSGSAAMRVPAPRGGRRWPSAALSVGLAAAILVTVMLVMRRSDDATAIGVLHPAEPAAS